MKTKLLFLVASILGFIVGAGAWMGLAWVGGTDVFEMRRGAGALFYMLSFIAFGCIGAMVAIAATMASKR